MTEPILHQTVKWREQYVSVSYTHLTLQTKA